MGYLANGKLLKVAVEFSLEDPQGGIHFVVPEGKIRLNLLENILFKMFDFYLELLAFKSTFKDLKTWAT